MYEAHPVFSLPESEDIKIWRYMDITKFLSMIDLGKLYFTRVDKFQDVFEGSLPQQYVRALEKKINTSQDSKGFRYFLKHQTKFHAINCWHINDIESAAMWQLYLKSDEGIAVQSNIKKFKGAFVDKETIYIGGVRYIDFNSPPIDIPTNGLAPFMLKRKSFEHEKELRALIWKMPDLNDGDNYFDAEPPIQHGVGVRINIDTLIESVFLAPGTPSWIEELLRSVLRKYEKSFEVRRSSLEEPPAF